SAIEAWKADRRGLAVFAKCTASHVTGEIYFFSSRRRHTRWPRDWSSDVCSSDLGERRVGRDPERAEPACGRADEASDPAAGQHRSEERRVGKECRTRWSSYCYT